MATDGDGLSRLRPPAKLGRPSPLALLCGGLLVVYIVRTAGYLAEAEGIFDRFGYLVGRDFVTWWLGGRLALDGQAASLFDPALFREAQTAIFGPAFPPHFWPYPPHSLFLMLPFGVPPYVWSLALWSLATFAAYATVALAGRAARWRLLTVLVLAPSTYLNLFLGQNGFVVAALLLAGLRLLETRPVLAGIAFGLLTVKPHLGLLIPLALLAVGAWRTIASAAITAAVLLAASVGVFGIEPWLLYFTKTTELQALYLTTDLTGFHYLMVTPFAAARHLGLPPEAGYAANAMTALAAAACVWWAWRRPSQPALRNAVLICATFLAVPYALAYDLTAVSVAVMTTWLALSDAERTLGVRAMLFAVWMLPFANHLANMHGLPIGPLVLAGFLALLLRLVARQSLSAPAAPSGCR